MRALISRARTYFRHRPEYGQCNQVLLRLVSTSIGDTWHLWRGGVAVHGSITKYRAVSLNIRQT